MARFERIKDRDNEFNIPKFEEPEWKAGYTFESSDYNGIEALGLIYAVDDSTGHIHAWQYLKRID